jgi:amino acid transporter
VIAVAGCSALLTVVAGMTGNGFGAMVDYMSPVYYVFIILGMGAAIRLRRAAQTREFPVRTPLFPLFPLTFGGIALVMLWWSLTELGRGALVGAGVMALGLVLERLARRGASPQSA